MIRTVGNVDVFVGQCRVELVVDLLGKHNAHSACIHALEQLHVVLAHVQVDLFLYCLSLSRFVLLSLTPIGFVVHVHVRELGVVCHLNFIVAVWILVQMDFIYIVVLIDLLFNVSCFDLVFDDYILVDVLTGLMFVTTILIQLTETVCATFHLHLHLHLNLSLSRMDIKIITTYIDLIQSVAHCWLYLFGQSIGTLEVFKPFHLIKIIQDFFV